MYSSMCVCGCGWVCLYAAKPRMAGCSRAAGQDPVSPSNSGSSRSSSRTLRQAMALCPSPVAPPGHYRNRCRQQTSLPSMVTAQPCLFHIHVQFASASSARNWPVRPGPCGWPSLGTLFRAACALLCSPTPALSAAILVQLEASLS